MLVKTQTNHFFLDQMMPETPIVIDIGACKGDFTFDMLYHYPKAEVIAYEPSKKNIVDFKSRFPMIASRWAAVVGKRESDTVKFKEYTGGSKGFCKKGHIDDGRVIDKRYDGFLVSYEVPCIDILQIVRPFNVIHLMKIDAEGCGLGIVKALKRIHAKKVLQISVEAIEDHRPKINDHLTSIGYKRIHSEGKEQFFVYEPS